ncbi:MAG TPA: hypothetical protein VKR58_14875, partial [Aquella sp.]|nr:hypothetical protein [Aquella sp.]
MSLADILANAANLAFLLFIFILLLKLAIKNKIAQLGLMVLFAIFVLFVKCYHGMTIVNIMRGVISDLSISGLLFLLLWAIIYFTKLSINLFDRRFCLIIALTGLVLYLSALDIIPFDIYGFGYMPQGFLIIIFFFCVLFLQINYVF